MMDGFPGEPAASAHDAGPAEDAAQPAGSGVGEGSASERPDPLRDHAFEEVRGQDDAAIWDAVARWRAEGRRFALITVIETRGFTPRKSGAHMLAGEAGTTWGTVGGGAIEHEALTMAGEMLKSGDRARVLRRHLTQELGMCCGGEMSLLIEVVETVPALYLFGAGYIARALAALAVGCGFRVTVVDERPEWADPARFPRASVQCRAPEEFLRQARLAPDDFAVVVTHDHAVDQRVVEELLRRPLAFLGMIGSVPKQRKFALRLRARGFSDEDIARLHTPLGVAIGAVTPEEIALSAMGEIVAARRGAPLGPPWAPPARHGEETSGPRPADARSPAPSREESSAEEVRPR